ncbi:MAG: hypothetical protein V4704_04795 [Pseudomonadota bacterium]
MATTTGARSNWADYRARSRTFWGVLLFGLAAAVAAAEFVLIEALGARGLWWPLTAWLVASAWAGHRLQSFMCPRCEHRFFRRSPPLLPIRAKRCVHCMLTKD